MRGILEERLAVWGMELDALALERLERYWQMLADWNTRMNLTAIVDKEEVALKHFVDSLALAAFGQLEEVESLADVGTGAGFPALPLKIAFPHLRLVLADAQKKRLAFLEAVIGELGLEHCLTVHGRAEDLGRQPGHREAYDLVVSRAVAHMSVLSEYCLPLARLGGCFVAYKGGDVEAELSQAAYAIKRLGGICRRREAYTLPGTDMGRSLLWLAKTAPTPKAYPRRAGVPAKEPLGMA